MFRNVVLLNAQSTSAISNTPYIKLSLSQTFSLVLSALSVTALINSFGISNLRIYVELFSRSLQRCLGLFSIHYLERFHFTYSNVERIHSKTLDGMFIFSYFNTATCQYIVKLMTLTKKGNDLRDLLPRFELLNVLGLINARKQSSTLTFLEENKVNIKKKINKGLYFYPSVALSYLPLVSWCIKYSISFASFFKFMKNQDFHYFLFFAVSNFFTSRMEVWDSGCQLYLFMASQPYCNTCLKLLIIPC